MKKKQIMNLIAVFMSGIMLKAHDRSEAYWLMRARDCAEEKMIITEHVALEVKNFAVKDENGKNIYQIALENHKQKQSVSCARLALFLEVEAQRLRKKLNQEVQILDEVEKTFETPHQ